MIVTRPEAAVGYLNPTAEPAQIPQLQVFVLMPFAARKWMPCRSGVSRRAPVSCGSGVSLLAAEV
jgi:hypothetical protein